MSCENINVKVTNKKALGLFFIHPFAAFLLAITNLKSKYSFTVIFLFFILFGYTFKVQNPSFDSYRYVEHFNLYKNFAANHYIDDIKNYFTFQSNIKDIYAISSFFIVSRISDNYHILFAIWALIFSYFFLKAFRFFVDRPEFKKSLVVSLLAFLFIYSNNIFNINGVRFWTAAWIAVYVIFEIVINKNYKFLLLAFITPLIHISYLYFVVILLLSLFPIKYEKVWVIIFILSFVVSELSVTFIQSLHHISPPFLQNMMWSYTDELNIEIHHDSFQSYPLYARILFSLPRLYINAFMVLFILYSKKIKSNSEAQAVYYFLLIWLSFANFTIAIPSFGGRFLVLSVPLMSYLALLIYKKTQFIRAFIYLAPFVYSYSLLYWFRYMASVTDPFLLVSVFPHIIIKNLF